MGTWPATNLLIRLDPRARGALQQQIYAGIRRAILDGVVAPGTRLPSSRALAADLGVSRTTAVLALEQLLAEGYLATRRGSGTFVAQDLPDDLPQGPRGPAGARAPGIRRCRAAARPWRRRRRAAGGSRARRGRSASGRPAVDLFPVRLWSQLATRRLRSVTAAQLDYGESGRHSPLREAIADARPDRARHAMRRRPGRGRGGRPAGPGPRLPPAARPGRPGLDGGARLPGRAQRAARRRRPDRAGARRRRGPGRRGGRAGRRRRAPGLRDAVAPVSRSASR